MCSSDLFFAEALHAPLADRAVRLVDLLERRGLAGADRPHGLVRDRHAMRVLGADLVEPRLEVALQHAVGAVRLADRAARTGAIFGVFGQPGTDLRSLSGNRSMRAAAR